MPSPGQVHPATGLPLSRASLEPQPDPCYSPCPGKGKRSRGARKGDERGTRKRRQRGALGDFQGFRAPTNDALRENHFLTHFVLPISVPVSHGQTWKPEQI